MTLLSRYKELKIYFRHSYFISKEDIKSYDIVIPIDVTSQQYYNSLSILNFLVIILIYMKFWMISHLVTK